MIKPTTLEPLGLSTVTKRLEMTPAGAVIHYSSPSGVTQYPAFVDGQPSMHVKFFLADLRDRLRTFRTPALGGIRC